MLTTLYFLYVLHCLGCTPTVAPHPYRTYAACMEHRPNRLSFCVRSPDEWVSKT